MTILNKSVLRRATLKNREKPYTVLVVDDEATNTANLEDCLSSKYQVLKAYDGQEAFEIVKKRVNEHPEPIQVLLADQRMPRMSGVDFLKRTLPLLPRAKRIVLTGYSDIDAVIAAINQAQVYRFLMKPWTPTVILKTISLAIETYEAERPLNVGVSEIVGTHPKLRECLALVDQVASTDATILIRGETGTGKELFARALYQRGNRRNKPFVTVHCGALPETLMEAELFGHKKGAFTGAQRDRQGRIAGAHQGTLFIDEIGEIPLTVQAKLLRFFQFGEIQRLGSDRVQKVDVRILAATHRNLKDMIALGSFREDLYYRLKLVELCLPPLRDRRDDIPLLVDRFLKQYWRRPGIPILHDDTLMILMGYPFPGNVRELAHIVERACLLSKSRELTPNLLPEEVLEHFAKSRPSREGDASVTFEALTNEILKRERQNACKRASDAVEKRFVKQLIAMHGGVAKAARSSGMARSYLHRLITKHGLR